MTEFTIDIAQNPEEEGGGFLYALYLIKPDDYSLLEIGAGHEQDLSTVFSNLQSLTERTI